MITCPWTNRSRLDALQQLETELGDLLPRPLDEISAEDLDEMLKRYAPFIDETTREALNQVLADLKQRLVDLQTELASLMANFGDQVHSVVLLQIPSIPNTLPHADRRNHVSRSIVPRGELESKRRR